MKTHVFLLSFPVQLAKYLLGEKNILTKNYRQKKRWSKLKLLHYAQTSRLI
jgi:hypothetical protein